MQENTLRIPRRPFRQVSVGTACQHDSNPSPKPALPRRGFTSHRQTGSSPKQPPGAGASRSRSLHRTQRSTEHSEAKEQRSTGTAKHRNTAERYPAPQIASKQTFRVLKAPNGRDPGSINELNHSSHRLFQEKEMTSAASVENNRKTGTWLINRSQSTGTDLTMTQPLRGLS